MMLTHISLFSGIEGIGLAAEWAGFKTICCVEMDDYCQKVIRKHWPSVPIINDIKDVNIDTIANICYNRWKGGELCDYAVNVKQTQQCQEMVGRDICAENAIENMQMNGVAGTERSGENIQTVGKKPNEIVSSSTMEESVPVAEKKPQNSSPLTIRTTTEAKNGSDTTTSKCGKSLLKEDSQMTTKSSATTATTQKKSMEYVPTKETSEVKDATKETILDIASSSRCLHRQTEKQPTERGQQALSESKSGSTDGYTKEIQTINPITLITGGFPCQPFSAAGKRKGEADNRYLWPEMLRVISEVRPTWVVAENVAGLISMVEFDSEPEVDNKVYSEEEMAASPLDMVPDRERTGRGSLDEIVASIEAEGYEVQTFFVPACGVNAPHQRYRIFIVGYNDSRRCMGKQAINGARCEKAPFECRSQDVGNPQLNGCKDRYTETRGQKPRSEQGGLCESEGTGDVANASNEGLEKPKESRQPKPILSVEQRSIPRGKEVMANTEAIRIQRRGAIGQQEPGLQVRKGLSGCDSSRSGADQWAVEPELGRVAHGIPNRVDRLKCLGNAVVPQLIYLILKAIADIEKGLT